MSKARREMLEKTGGFTDAHRENLSKAQIEVMKRGHDASTFFLRGWHYSEKTGKYMVFRSSYEKKAFEILDANPEVVAYYYEGITVKYFHPKKGKFAAYLIDLKVLLKDGDAFVVEIKPEKKTKKDAVTIAKIRAAEEWCAANDIDFFIWTEFDLFGKIENYKMQKEYNIALKAYLKSDEYNKMVADNGLAKVAIMEEDKGVDL